MTKAKHIEGIYYRIVLSIECSKCPLLVRDDDDEMEFAKRLYKKGWRFENEDAVCPKCRQRSWLSQPITPPVQENR